MKNKTALLLSVLAISGCVHDTKPAPVMNGVTPRGDISAEPKADAPLTATTHFAAGQLAESQSDMPRAIAQYQIALKIDPRFQPALLRLGMAYTSLQQFDDAINIWHRYIAATSNSAAGYCDLGFTLEVANRPGEAEAAYKAAIAKEPKNEAARVNYGLMLARQNRINPALEQLQVVLTPAEAHYNIASVLEEQKKIDEAKAQYREALRLDPEMSDAKSRLTGLDTAEVEQ